ncbi:pilus assembly protein CpaC [Acidovorax sp. 62]|nr:pilus assembly protein CpaC [Acidovorax sp. 62]
MKFSILSPMPRPCFALLCMALFGPVAAHALTLSGSLDTAAPAQAAKSPDAVRAAAMGELIRAAQGLQATSEPKSPSAPNAPASAQSPGFRSVPVLATAQSGDAAVAANGAAPLRRQPTVLNALPSSLSLYVGQMSLIEIGDVARVAVGNGKVMEARVVDGKNMLLTALDGGESTIHVWNKRGQVKSVKVRVNVMDLDRIHEEISSLTAGIAGVSLFRVGEKIILDGANLDPAAVSRLRDIAALYGPAVVSFATSERLRVDRMVEVQVRIVEFTKSALDDLGMKWSTSADGFNFGLFSDIASNSNFRVLPDGSPYLNTDNNYGSGALLGQTRRSPQYYFGLSTALHSTINLQVQRGNAYLLASPTLTTRSGGDAKFLSGGEIPLPAMSALGTGSVSYKPYGLRLDIKPVADGVGTISGSLLAEVSSIDQSVSVQGIPGLQTRRTETEFNVNDGDTIVISGLLSRSSTRGSDGLPGLRNLPVLGWAFKNANDSDKLLETVVFLTPRVVNPKDSVSRIERVNKLEKNISQGFGDLTEDLSDTPPKKLPTPVNLDALDPR